MKKIIFSTALILMLTGCASVPDEVKVDMNNYHYSKSNASDDFDFNYIKVENLSAEAKEALDKDYGQFAVSDKINFVQPSEINIMSFQNISDFSDKVDDAKALFFTKSEIPEKSKDEAIDALYYYWSDTKKKYFAITNYGMFAMLKPDAFDVSFGCRKPNVKIYHPDRTDDLSDEYQLKDGKCSVADAVKYINNWFETNYKPLAPYYDYQVNTVIVRENESNYFYQFFVEAIYNGVPIDSYTMEGERTDGEDASNMAYIKHSISIQMHNVNSIDSFSTGSGIPVPKVEEKINECISLESALNFCENTFTDFRDVTISDIDIMYTLNPVYETDDEGNLFVSGYNSRPVWEFIIDVPPEEFLADGDINTYGDMRKYIYVDMVTGELKYNFDIVYQGLGG